MSEPTAAAADPALGPLRHRRDLQSLAYLLLQPALMLWQWRHGIALPAYLAMLFLAVGVSVIHHNHAHLPLWRKRALNRATDLWITALQGHPTCVFHPAHNRNHHRHRHGPGDLARTWRFGDHNHLLGWALHPLQAAAVLYPAILRWLAALRRRAPGAFRWCLLQYALWLVSWLAALAIDPFKALALVILPQLFGLHWLLGANYLQHAHADDGARYGYARNFGGWVNPLLFNIGLHTAHHEHGRAHWSRLPELHRRYRAAIDPRLLEPGLAGYVLRTLVLGPILPRHRSRSLRARGAAPAFKEN
ncbi:fatty acid desaturase [Vulcaniibacterium tengchongense]|uniref:Fatty acid desaturase n=1 Tax=Vulcaniibacterium tengchongense TaxID=1273429 RepID=A0A3N4VMV1_9GAMM|nr:fatty acid desaturase [Vulcaniibacterium tengchongense]RPE81149.1 fatty acid desaturase [Vulcaniibacterium tengchongense]